MKHAALLAICLIGFGVVVAQSGCDTRSNCENNLGFGNNCGGGSNTSTSSTGGSTPTHAGCEHYTNVVLNCGTNAEPICKNLQSDPYNCGACGNTCKGVSEVGYFCHDGKCAYDDCSFPYADCNHDVDPNKQGVGDGCESNLNTDPQHCGGCEAYRACKPGQICVVGKCEDPSGSGGAGGGTTTGAGGSGTGGQGGAGGGCSVNKKYCGNPAMCTVQTVENGCNAQACDAPCFKANNSDGSMCDGLGGPCLVICEQAKQDTAGHLDCDGDANNPAGNGCEFDLHNASRCTCPGDGNPDCPQGKKCGTVQVNGVWMPTCL